MNNFKTLVLAALLAISAGAAVGGYQVNGNNGVGNQGNNQTGQDNSVHGDEMSGSNENHGIDMSEGNVNNTHPHDGSPAEVVIGSNWTSGDVTTLTPTKGGFAGVTFVISDGPYSDTVRVGSTGGVFRNK